MVERRSQTPPSAARPGERHGPARASAPREARGSAHAARFGNKALAVVTLGLVLAAALTLRPLWAPLVLAAWLAVIVRPLHQRVSRALHGSSRAAGLITVFVVLAALAPFTLIVLSLASDAATLARSLVGSGSLPAGVQRLLEAGPFDRTPKQVVELARHYGGSALSVATALAGATASAIIGAFIFATAFFVFLVDGKRLYAWLFRNLPLQPAHIERLAGAFTETGRGLLVGVGLTAALQGLVAGVGYAVVGVPHAMVLGLLTGVAALIPAVGTGLVWVPVAGALFLAGRTGAGVAIVVVGSIVAVTDNFVRPYLSHHAQLRLPTYLLLLAMLGGVAAFGPWGLILGPLFIRLTVEALALVRDATGSQRRNSRSEPRSEPPPAHT